MVIKSPEYFINALILSLKPDRREVEGINEVFRAFNDHNART